MEGLLGENLPIPVLVMLLAFGAFSFLLGRTVFGRQVIAVGSNESAARLAGIPVRRTKMLVYVVMGAVSGVAYGTDGAEQGSMGTDFGDYDGDGHLDIVVTNFSHQYYQLFRQAGDGFFEDVTYTSGLAKATYLALGWGAEFFDYDNDGHLDLFFVNGHVYPGVDQMQIGTTYRQRNQLMRNVPAATGGGRLFEAVAATIAGFQARQSYRSGGSFDYDRDGDLDLLFTIIDGHPVMLRNNAGSSRQWVAVRLVGTRTNRSGLGARLTATAGGRKIVRHSGGGSFFWGADSRVLIGLADASAVQRLEVTWPGGHTQSFENVRAGVEYLLVEGESLQEIAQ